MKAILKDIGISSTKTTPYNFTPEEENCFSIWFDLYIGTPEEPGEDNFKLFICTPEWLCKNQWTPELMRHTLLIRKYNLEKIKKAITDYIDKCEGNDWEEVAEKLSRMFFWEFEDFVEFSE